MRLVKVACPQCGGSVEVDKNFETARCPFCNSSFAIENEHYESEHVEHGVFATTIAECSPDDVKKELEIYSLFGWDFKERRSHRITDGKIRYSDGSSKVKYKDVVQLTFQRNVKALWCTKELLQKEKEFFDIRKEYLDELNKHKSVDSELLKMYKEAKSANKYYFMIGLSFSVSLILTIIFLILCINSGTGIFGVFSFIFFVIGVTAVVLLTHQMNIDTRKQKETFGKVLQKKEIEYYGKQKTRLLKMNEIATWAGEQMEMKFGYKLTPSLESENIELYKLKTK